MTHFSDRLRTGAYFPGHGYAVDPGVEMSPLYVFNVVPATLDPDGIAEAQAVAGAGNLTINGALASGGSVTLDTPRNVQIVSSGAGDTTQTATVTGKDVYGYTMTETIAFNGTNAVQGKKAFKIVSQIAISAVMAGNASAGSGDVLGMPIFVGDINYYLKVSWASALAADAATVLAGVTTTATATTGDVRGTVDPSSATDGSRRLTVYIFSANPDTEAGLYGVAQA